MELMLIECNTCSDTFGTINETGEHKCPSCGSKNERYLFDNDVTDKEVELIGKIYKDIRDVFNTYGMEDVSSIKIIDLIVGK